MLERSSWVEPRIFAEIQRLGSVDEAEMDRVFNRGIGMALVVGRPGRRCPGPPWRRADQPATVIGVVVDGRQGAVIR